jgi:putative FmdB family regulatory protein
MFVPTYEYECPKCPRVFEVKQRITEPPLKVCDRCGGPIHRLLSATPFILKGGGWYVTDYPSEARKQGAKSESTSGQSAPAASDSAPATGDSAAAGNSAAAAPKESSTSQETSSQSEKSKASEKSKEKSKGEAKAKPKASGSSA